LKLVLEGVAIVQAISRRPVTAEACVRSRVNACDIRGTLSSCGT